MKRAALVAAVLFLALGAGGFVPALTPDERFLGIFETGRLHNLVCIGPVFGMLMNRPDDVLHFFIAAFSLWLGFAWDRTQSPSVFPA